jgi:hypothetical protein
MLKFMKTWQKVAIGLALVFLGLKMCGGSGDSVEDIAGIYVLTTDDRESLRIEVLKDGRVRFEQHMSTTVGQVTDVYDGVFAVDFGQRVYLSVQTNTGSKMLGRGPLIFDPNSNSMYWGYDDYKNKDITTVDVAKVFLIERF